MQRTSIALLLLPLSFAMQACLPRHQAPDLGIPQISFFRARPNVVQPGDAVTLSWSVNPAATEVVLDEDPHPSAALFTSEKPSLGSVPVRGSLRVRPKRTTIYVLSCKGPGWDVATSRTVRVVVRSPGHLEKAPE